jgi:hypothetical protein
MRTQRRVFEKLSESTKVELASERIELGLAQDFLKEYKKAQSTFDDGVSAIDRASELAEVANKTYLEIQKISKDLGVPVDKNIKRLGDNLDFYIKAINKLK